MLFGKKKTESPSPVGGAAPSAGNTSAPKFARRDPKPLVVGGTVLSVLSGMVSIVTLPLLIFGYAGALGQAGRLDRLAGKSPGFIKKAGRGAIKAATTTPADLAHTRAGGTIGRFAHQTLGDRTAGRISQIPISQGIVAASTAMGGFMLTRSFSRKISMLQHMEAEISGRKVTKMDVIRGKVSPIVAKARTEALGWFSIGALGFEFGMAAYCISRIFSNKMDVGGMPLDAMQRGFRKSDIAIIAGNVAVTKIVPDMINTLRQSQTILAGYEMAHKAMAAGQPIPLDAYQAMLRGLVPGAYMSDKPRSKTDPYNQRMLTDAIECYNQQIPPQQFLKIISAELYPKSEVGTWTAKTLDKTSGSQAETWAAKAQEEKQQKATKSSLALSA